MRYVSIILILAAMAVQSAAQDNPLPKLQEQLTEISPKLQASPEVEKYRQGKAIRLSYNTRKFMVHNADKVGGYSKEAFERLGPEKDGLIIDATLFDGDYECCAVVPQTMRRTYWTSYVNSYPIDDGRRHILVWISYGCRTDKKLIERVKDVFFNISDKKPFMPKFHGHNPPITTQPAHPPKLRSIFMKKMDIPEFPWINYCRDCPQWISSINVPHIGKDIYSTCQTFFGTDCPTQEFIDENLYCVAHGRDFPYDTAFLRWRTKENDIMLVVNSKFIVIFTMKNNAILPVDSKQPPLKQQFQDYMLYVQDNAACQIYFKSYYLLYNNTSKVMPPPYVQTNTPDAEWFKSYFDIDKQPKLSSKQQRMQRLKHIQEFNKQSGDDKGADDNMIDENGNVKYKTLKVEDVCR